MRLCLKWTRLILLLCLCTGPCVLLRAVETTCQVIFRTDFPKDQCTLLKVEEATFQKTLPHTFKDHDEVAGDLTFDDSREYCQVVCQITDGPHTRRYPLELKQLQGKQSVTITISSKQSLIIPQAGPKRSPGSDLTVGYGLPDDGARKQQDVGQDDAKINPKEQLKAGAAEQSRLVRGKRKRTKSLTGILKKDGRPGSNKQRRVQFNPSPAIKKIPSVVTDSTDDMEPGAWREHLSPNDATSHQDANNTS